MKIPSKTRKGKYHEVSKDSCTCEHFQMTKSDCSHMKYLKHRIMGKEPLELNEKLVSITGKTPIESTLALDMEVVIKGRGQIVKEEQLNRQDGTYDQVYVIKLYELEVEDERHV